LSGVNEFRGVIEDGHSVDINQGGKGAGAIVFIDDRPVWFESSDGSVAVDAHEKESSQAAHALDLSDVAVVDEVEAAGGDQERMKGVPGHFAPESQFRKRYDFDAGVHPYGGFTK
jgi:hypothetical protein